MDSACAAIRRLVNVGGTPELLAGIPVTRERSVLLTDISSPSRSGVDFVLKAV